MELQADHLLPQQRCPYCGHTVNRAGGGEEQPSIGDIAVCIQCGRPSELGPGRLLMPLDLDDLSEDALMMILRAQHAIILVQEADRRKRK